MSSKQEIPRTDGDFPSGENIPFKAETEDYTLIL